MSDADGFLSRWSRRKAQLRSGERAVEPPIAPPTAQPVVPIMRAVPPAGAAEVAPPPAATGLAPPPLPTLEEVAQLGRDADFSRFVSPGVDETVKRAALKKLFSDPHFNVMDGLDTYIDDYGKPDPIPAAMLRRMTQSKVLRLFDDELPDDAARAQGLAHPTIPAAAAAPPEIRNDEDAALRLQPDDAADAAGARPHRPGPRP
jgi:hypothetical protein